MTSTVPLIAAETPVAPPGTYTTSWLGNSFMKVNGSQEETVPEELEDMAVSANGTVFTAGYHERGGGGAAFNGSTGAFAGRYSGFNSGFGEPSNGVAADNTYVYFGTKVGMKRYLHGGGNTNTSFLDGHAIMGVALKDGLLYLSDYTYNRIRVYNAGTLTEVRSWAMSKPTRIAVDNNNRVWVIQEAATTIQPVNEGPMWFGGAILSFSDTGKPGQSITNFEKPMALEVNRATNQLYVGGLNQHSQLWIYNNLAGTPAKVGTFGTLNGIFSGTAGEFSTAAKLHWIRASTSIVRAMSMSLALTALSGDRQWRSLRRRVLLYGAYSVPRRLMEVALTPPMKPLFTPSSSLQNELGQYHTRQRMVAQGFTVNRFKYPNDPRVDHLSDVGSRSLGYGAVRIRGRLFMIRSDQGGYRFEMFRFNPKTDGQVAIPSVVMAIGANHVIKRDTNGNGRFDATNRIRATQDTTSIGKSR
jgi:prepilin-type processing-associated H-X9-DG protein